jgi:uncharacterized protein (DUF433 family)
MPTVISKNHHPEHADPYERPRYGIGQAARYVQISPTTLRSWVVGRPYSTSEGSRYFEPLISRPDPSDARLSFSNLREAHVLRSLRTRHQVPMSAVRIALDYAAAELNIKRLLLSRELMADAGSLFIERLGQLIDLGRSGQIALKEMFDQHLSRIQWEPLRLFPVVAARGLSGPRIVSIDPQVSFGRPFIVGKGVRTATIVERLDAGEEREMVAADYQLEDHEIDEAILYERAAA